MFWLILATGFTGGLTFVFLIRLLHRAIAQPCSLETLLVPATDPTERLVAELKAARREVLVQGLAFTSHPIAEALVEVKLRGVPVEVILDPAEEQDPASQLHFLLEQGLAPLIDPTHALLRRQMILIDKRLLIVGSSPLSVPSEAEEVPVDAIQIIRGYSETLQAYRQDFADHRQHARSPEIKCKPLVQPRSPARSPDTALLPPSDPETPSSAQPSPSKVA